MTNTTTREEIVAGVDGSPEAAEALSWAIGEARVHGAALRVVHGFDVPSSGVEKMAGDLYPSLAEDAKGVIERVAQSAPSTEGLDVSYAAVAGPPAKVLVEASRDASLLVVGKRGHGALHGLELGSVANKCVHHAQCPVVVVR